MLVITYLIRNFPFQVWGKDQGDGTIDMDICRHRDRDIVIEGSLNSNFRQYGELKSRDEKQMR